jgi:hypothetical protein
MTNVFSVKKVLCLFGEYAKIQNFKNVALPLPIGPVKYFFLSIPFLILDALKWKKEPTQATDPFTQTQLSCTF